MSKLTDEQRRELDALNRTRWFDRAACAGAPFALFDTAESHDHQPSRKRAKRIEQARAICASCPVVAECRRDAEILPDPSFRAGHTARERTAQRRAAS